MNKSIKLSKKHGVNPTIPRCFWCGNSRNEVVLLGELPGDVAAPMHSIIDYEPCNNCAAKWAKGIAIFEVDTTGVGMPWHGAYPTGRYVVLRKEAVEEPFCQQDKLFMEKDEFDQIFGNASDNFNS